MMATMCGHPRLIGIGWGLEGRTNGGSRQGRCWRVNGYRGEFDRVYRGQGAGVNGAAGQESTGLVRTSGLPARWTETWDIKSSRTACGDTSKRG